MDGIGTAEPAGNGVGPLGGSGKRGMSMVLTTFELQIATVEIAVLAHIADDDVVDAGVLLPVGWAYPYVGDVANLREDGLDVLVALVEVVDEELVSAEADNDVGGLHLAHEMLQGVGLGPELRRRAVPHHGVELVAVGLGVVDEPTGESLEHGVAEEQNALMSGVGRETSLGNAVLTGLLSRKPRRRRQAVGRTGLKDSIDLRTRQTCVELYVILEGKRIEQHYAQSCGEQEE